MTTLDEIDHAILIRTIPLVRDGAKTLPDLADATVFALKRRPLELLEKVKGLLTDETRARFVPSVPDGFVPLAEAAKRLGVARQTVLHQVQRGERRAIEVTQGRRSGLRIEVPADDLGLFGQP